MDLKDKDDSSRISVIIPIYNTEKYLKRCLNSVINQTYKNIEIILINDGSTDHSKEICETLTRQDKRIKMINKTNSGVSNTRNTGIKNSRGEYLFFVDSDDYIEKDCLEKMINKLEKEKSDICICGYYIEKNKLKEKIHISNNKNLQFKKLIFDLDSNILGYPWGKLVKKNNIKVEFNNNISIKEDLVFWLENSESIKKISIIDEPLYNYILNNSSLLNSKKIDEKKISVLKANDFIINYDIPEYIKYKEINEFLANYLLFKAIGTREIIDVMELEYGEKFENYYKIYMKSNYSLKNKMKLFVKRRLFVVYKFFKEIKGE